MSGLDAPMSLHHDVTSVDIRMPGPRDVLVAAAGFASRVPHPPRSARGIFPPNS